MHVGYVLNCLSSTVCLLTPFLLPFASYPLTLPPSNHFSPLLSLVYSLLSSSLLQTTSMCLLRVAMKSQKGLREKSVSSSAILHLMESLSLTSMSPSLPWTALPLVCLIEQSSRCYHIHCKEATVTSGMQ